ncbi:MAG: hypothetical protein HXX08_06970 [Chloroflexi bacterium]|uniref:Uncharacterized protein n=1 Tax=Candidatus Chlorohelix allophototropha TaxID=3003348 RepID=A0A8T7LXB2_9CHLR|nr:hypothetical protein [Chloroflexota bacterium]WJW67476.1 hypothetical protein OZ401_000742 [Chloroflexota bacterium L227-S17]
MNEPMQGRERQMANQACYSRMANQPQAFALPTATPLNLINPLILLLISLIIISLIGLLLVISPLGL